MNRELTLNYNRSVYSKQLALKFCHHYNDTSALQFRNGIRRALFSSACPQGRVCTEDCSTIAHRYFDHLCNKCRYLCVLTSQVEIRKVEKKLRIYFVDGDGDGGGPLIYMN